MSPQPTTVDDAVLLTGAVAGVGLEFISRCDGILDDSISGAIEAAPLPKFAGLCSGTGSADVTNEPMKCCHRLWLNADIFIVRD